MNTNQTIAQMRTLNLTGMARAYQSLLQLPLNEHPTADMLIAQLIEAEVLERNHRKMLTTIKAAKFRYQAAIEEIDFLAQRNLDKNTILRLSDVSFIKRAENVLITGATGCGKSYIASALGFKACQMGNRVAYFSMTKLLQRLQMAKADGSYIKELAKIEKTQLLILDDWGMEKLSGEQSNHLLELLEDRYQTSSTIMVSQLPVSDWYSMIGNATVADAILDRLIHNSHRIELSGESMRKLEQTGQLK